MTNVRKDMTQRRSGFCPIRGGSGFVSPSRMSQEREGPTCAALSAVVHAAWVRLRYRHQVPTSHRPSCMDYEIWEHKIQRIRASVLMLGCWDVASSGVISGLAFRRGIKLECEPVYSLHRAQFEYGGSNLLTAVRYIFVVGFWVGGWVQVLLVGFSDISPGWV